jgi:hypothetical protein
MIWPQKNTKITKEADYEPPSLRSLRSFAANAFWPDLAGMREIRAIARHNIYFLRLD